MLNAYDNRLTSEATVGDFLRYESPDGTVEFGEVFEEDADTVTVTWGAEIEVYLRDFLDQPAFRLATDMEAY